MQTFLKQKTTTIYLATFSLGQKLYRMLHTFTYVPALLSDYLLGMPCSAIKSGVRSYVPEHDGFDAVLRAP